MSAGYSARSTVDSPSVPDGIGTSEPRRHSGRTRKPLRRLASLGPFVLVFGIYGILIDHVPTAWFRWDWLRYLLAGSVAISVGLGLRLLLRWTPISRFLGESEPAVTALLPSPRKSPENTSVRDIFEVNRQRLVADCRSRKRGNAEAHGWSQFYGDKVPPGPIGSSYGLRLAMALDVRDLAIDRRRIIDSVLALQRTGGGWSASSQRDVGRPEVTAWVLGGIVPAGLDTRTRDRLVRILEEMLDPTRDPDGMSKTCVLTTVICTLARVAPRSPRLPELATRLAQAAHITGGGSPQAAWGMSIGDPRVKLSVPHTARAVVALHRAAIALPGDSLLHQRSGAGAAWLAANPDLTLHDEQIRRPLRDDVDALYVSHFTPAWVARALMLVGGPQYAAHLRSAVDAVYRHQEEGVWTWQGQAPIWMSYQAIIVLREYVIRTHRWAP